MPATRDFLELQSNKSGRSKWRRNVQRLKAEFEAQPWKTGIRKSTRVELELSQEKVDQLYQQLSQ